MFQVKRLYSSLASLALLCTAAFVSCSMHVTEEKKPVVEYGSLTVSSGEQSRALEVSSIKYVKALVTGTGISNSSVPSSDFVEISGGTGRNISVPNIPTGSNRIVTIQGYDKSKTLVSGAVIRNIADISAGSGNSCSVTQGTTALANVFVKLHSEGVNLAGVDKTAINSALPSGKSWSLIDTDKIALDYKNNALSSSSSYVKASGTISVSSSLINSYEIRITDPSSGAFTLSSSSSSKTVSDAAPGTWCVVAISNNEVVARDNKVVVAAGETTTINVSESSGGNVSGKIVVHVPTSCGYTHAYAWSDSAVSAAWPGDEMKLNGSNYDYELACTSSKILFNNGGDSNKTNDMYITEGEWNYNGSNTLTTSDVSANFTAVESGGDGETTVTFKVTNPSTGDDCIKVHAKYTHIWAWETGNDSNNYTGGKWPGAAMTEEADGWYTYTIKQDSASIIFSNNGSSQHSAVGDTKTAGEYWYKDGKWYESNPDDAVAPVLVSFTADKTGTVTGDVVLTVSGTDNMALSKAVITCGTKTIGTITLSGKSDEGTYTWGTSKIQNGSYTLVATVYDGAGNTSETDSLSFTTSNVNLPPVAVISGAGSAPTGSEKTYKAAQSYDQNGGTISTYEWTVTGAVVKSGAGTDSIVVTMPSTEGDTVTIKLRVKDDDGAWSEYVTQSVVIRNQDPDWDFRDESIYFLMTTRFYDGNKGNNVYCWDEGGEYLPYGSGDCAWRGDFKGLIDKLDYIKALGFSAIWITPVVVNASGIDYHGYHAFDFSHVDPRYGSGTPVYDAKGDDISGDQAYQELINAVHDKGMKIIQDIVLNHTGNWGEKNINHIFDKAKTSETDSLGYKRAPVMVANEDSPIMKAATGYYGYGSYAEAYAAAQRGVKHDNNVADYAVRLIALKNDTGDYNHYYHHETMIDWNSELCQLGSMAGDCVDLNTENPDVAAYLRECYIKYINMGVDAFRIDTVKHISRLTFNKEFNDQFMEAGGEKFFMFGETCARYCGRWNEGVPALSPSFYTWKETTDFPWSSTDYTVNRASATAHFAAYKSDFAHPSLAGGIANHLLNGNEYHTPDYSMRSHLDQIDFPMHWAFRDAPNAFGTAVNVNDPDFNDATWNVVYVDSHDYAPDNAPEGKRYTNVAEWPRNMNLMFTFRGIPCIYYGSEIEFMSGKAIDPANARCQLNESGRAYFGDNIEGRVTATDFGVYTAEPKSAVETTLNHELAQHVRRLNLIRRAIPALRKGQYSTEGCSGSIAFKRRYTKNGVDSFALVAIGGQASFSGIPSGQYIEVITGTPVSSNGSLTTDSIGKDNMRVYVLQTGDGVEPTGQIGETGEYLK